MANLKRMLQANGRSYACMGASNARVTLPMTDSDERASLPGVAQVLTRAQRLGLPTDRFGSSVVQGDHLAVLGSGAFEHGRNALDVPLRSHGSLCKHKRRRLLHRPSQASLANRRLRNSDAFDLLFTHTGASGELQ